MNRICHRLFFLILGISGAVSSVSAGEGPVDRSMGAGSPGPVYRVDPDSDQNAFEKAAFTFFTHIDELERSKEGAGVDHVEKTLLMDVNDAYVYVQSARRAVMEFGGAGESWIKTFCDNIQGRLLGEDVASVAEAVEERLEQRQVELVRQVQGGLSDVDRLVAEVYISKVIQPGRTSFKTDYKKLYEPGRDYSQTMRDRCAQLGNDELSDDMQANLELRRKRINRESVR